MILKNKKGKASERWKKKTKKAEGNGFRFPFDLLPSQFHSSTTSREGLKLNICTNPLGKDKVHNIYCFLRRKGGSLLKAVLDSKQWGYYIIKEGLDDVTPNLDGGIILARGGYKWSLESMELVLNYKTQYNMVFPLISLDYASGQYTGDIASKSELGIRATKSALPSVEE